MTFAIVAVWVTWRSNVTCRRHLDEQLERGWQQTVRQLKHEADQRGKQRVHEAEQLSARLQHDAEQRLREQESALRRRVLMEAAESLFKLHTLIGRMSSAESDESGLWESYADNQARVVQLHLIAAGSTIEAVMVYLNELAPSLLELSLMRRQCRSEAGGASEGRGKVIPHEEFLVDYERRLELSRRTISLSHQSARLLASSLLALRSEMGGELDQRRYEQMWLVMAGKMEYLWKQDMESMKSLASALRSAGSAPPA